MFNLKKQDNTNDGITHAMLAEIQKTINELTYQNHELRRSLTRLETKLCKMAIALKVGDSVTRG